MAHEALDVARRPRVRTIIALLGALLLATTMVVAVAQPAESFGNRHFSYRSCKGLGSTSMVNMDRARSYTSEAAHYWYCVDRVSVRMSYCASYGVGCRTTSWRYGGRFVSVYSPSWASVYWASGSHRIKVDGYWSPINYS